MVFGMYSKQDLFQVTKLFRDTCVFVFRVIGYIHYMFMSSKPMSVVGRSLFNKGKIGLTRQSLLEVAVRRNQYYINTLVSEQLPIAPTKHVT